MNLNTICLRIFFVLFIGIMGSLMVSLFGVRVATPLLVSFLPTDTAEAHYSDPLLLVEYSTNSTQQLYHSKIVYAGHTATLLTTSEPGPMFTVRYVRAFPSIVVRDLAGASLWDYYADTWTAREATPFLICTALLILVAYCSCRHIRNSRRSHYRPAFRRLS
jgi:hypothetical protein